MMVATRQGWGGRRDLVSHIFEFLFLLKLMAGSLFASEVHSAVRVYLQKYSIAGTNLVMFYITRGTL